MWQRTSARHSHLYAALFPRSLCVVTTRSCQRAAEPQPLHLALFPRTHGGHPTLERARVHHRVYPLRRHRDGVRRTCESKERPSSLTLFSMSRLLFAALRGMPRHPGPSANSRRHSGILSAYTPASGAICSHSRLPHVLNCLDRCAAGSHSAAHRPGGSAGARVQGACRR